MQRILVVDDEPVVQRVLARLLRGAGYEVQTAGDGRTALAVMAGFSPHLVVLDLCMPRMDGMEFMERVGRREDSPLILVLTGNGCLDAVRKAVGLGAYDFILKPFELDYVKKNVSSMLSSRAIACP